MSRCDVCFRNCYIPEGRAGFCGVRVCRNGKIVPDSYGVLTAIALDPIEKKPLHRFHPGSKILSVGSYGCNLHCPFCQNHDISWPQDKDRLIRGSYRMSPEELTDLAASCREDGNIGIAFTYNEPLIGWEFVRDTARLVHETGMKNAMVTNGTARIEILEELLPFIDAMNIDLKGFTDRYYRDVLSGDRKMVMDFIERAARDCHVELTTLIVPGENDSPEEIDRLTEWVASIDKGIPLHLTRFFPQFEMTDRRATDVALIYRLADQARGRLNYVYTGNC